VTNSSKTLHINFYQNRSSIVEVMTKNWCIFIPHSVHSLAYRERKARPISRTCDTVELDSDEVAVSLQSTERSSWREQDDRLTEATSTSTIARCRWNACSLRTFRRVCWTLRYHCIRLVRLHVYRNGRDQQILLRTVLDLLILDIFQLIFAAKELILIFGIVLVVAVVMIVVVPVRSGSSKTQY